MTVQPSSSREFYSPAQAAELLCCTPAHVRRLISQGALVAANLASDAKGRPLWVIPKSEIAASVELRTETWNEKGDALAFVLSKNLHRRHMQESQLGMVAGAIANLEKHLHKKTDSSKELSVSQEEAAKTLGISVSTVKRARKVLGSGDAGLIAAVNRGEIKLDLAEKVARAPAKQQRAEQLYETELGDLTNVGKTRLGRALETVAQAKAAGPGAEREIGVVGGKAGPGRGKKTSAVVTRFTRGSNASSYLARRLLRDHPAHFAQLEAGAFTSVRAAAIAAGIVKVPTILDLLDQATVGPAHVHHDRNNGTVNTGEPIRGQTRQYALRRLRKSAPEIHARVLAGEMSPNRGMKLAGFRRDPTPFELLERAWGKASTEERLQFLTRVAGVERGNAS